MRVKVMGFGVVAIAATAALIVPPSGDHELTAPLLRGDGAVTAAPNLTNTRLGLGKSGPGAAQTRPSEGRGAHFLVAPGQSGRSGPGKLLRFKVEVEAGIKGISVRRFAAEVEDRLMDHRSWGNTDGRALQRISTGKADFRVTLTKSGTVDKMCFPRTTMGFVSCFMHGRAVINLQRWRDGAPDFPTLNQYRTYLINHEVGHGLAKTHWFCPPSGGPGRLMMQQTYTMADKCDPQRFARPNAPRFKTRCTVATHNHNGRLFLQGSVSHTPWSQKMTLTHHDDQGTHTLGVVKTTTSGDFSVAVDAPVLSPSTHTVSVFFAGSRDLQGCSAKTALTPNA